MEPGGTDRRLVHLIAHSDGISRTELARELALPPATVASAVRRLLADGTAIEREHTGTRTVAGRRPHLLFPTGTPPCLGLVELSRSGVGLVLADYAGRVLQRSTTAQLDPGADPAAFAAAVEALRRSARRLRPHRAITAVVIAVPAPFQRGVGSPGQRLPVRRGDPQAAPTFELGAPHFYGGLAEDPSAALSDGFGVPVLLENDANLAALGEYTAGAGRGRPDQLHLLLSDHGIGCGLIVSGRLVRGASGYAGELAHVQVDEEGPLCACGGRGCLATRLGRPLLDSVQGAYAQPVTFTDLLTMAGRGDPGPARILTDVGRLVGRPLADVCTVLNPGLIVVDGRLGAAAPYVVAGVRDRIERHTPPAIGASVEIAVGELPDSAAVHGAVHLVRRGR